MGWIVVLLIAIAVFVIWLSKRKRPTRTAPTPSTTTQVSRRVKTRQTEIGGLLRQAYVGKFRVKMKYETRYPLPGEPAVKVRDIDIYGLGNGYIDAYCHYRSALRTFKVSRVLWAWLSDERYQIPSDYIPSGWVTKGWGELRRETVAE